MDVPSKCTIFKTMGRPAHILEVLSRGNRAKGRQNPKLHAIEVASTVVTYEKTAFRVCKALS
jgi:hypothetical protein